MTFMYGFLAISLLLVAPFFAADRRISNQIYIIYGIALCLLVLFKPFGSAPDDYNYIELTKLGCTSYSCDDSFSVNRDFIWFFLALLSPLNFEFLTIKTIALLSFGAKLYLIFKLSSNKIYAICVYTFAFYFLHDLTQYRVALAITFFLFAIYFASQSRSVPTLFTFMGSVGSHIQAAPSIILFLLPKWLKSRRALLWMMSVSLTFVAFGLLPTLDWLISVYVLLSGIDYDASSGIGKYIYLGDTGAYSEMRRVSIIAFVIMVSLWFLKFRPDFFESSNRMRARALALSWGSLFIGFSLYFVFASVLDMQNRFFEFFLVPLVLIFGNCRHTPRNYFVLLFLCVSLFVKFHLINNFFLT
jgi:hypothetical protein